MGVVFAISFFILLLIAGILGIGIGIVALIISLIIRKKKVPSRILTAAAALVLSFSLIITIIPVGFFSFIFLVNIMPPLDYVETDIVIEENGYQFDRFTADGVVYERVGLELYRYVFDIGTPIFSYKTEGFLNGSQWGNYFAIENSAGFNLVSDDMGTLFAPTDEKEAVIEYFNNAENMRIWYEGDFFDEVTTMSAEDSKAVYRFVLEEWENMPQQKIKMSEDLFSHTDSFYVDVVDKDGLVWVNSFEFVLWEGNLYYSEMLEYDGHGSYYYTAVELPSEIEEILIDFFEIEK